eukprot:CAMPEP_0171079090 /NCGR_PEP_ID=MMETSP0766_2-20121228/15037_1 /TAXON_ID=439317 /ORGANISM="Gambierdiscus australes, Strain CAWD 149" /LENGTH=199 /DNA_ID=CAMNT_0011536255 /DNA_START=525 /DNA_END=1121 /DNA_ORIENTATION=-
MISQFMPLSQCHDKVLFMPGNKLPDDREGRGGPHFAQRIQHISNARVGPAKSARCIVKTQSNMILHAWELGDIKAAQRGVSQRRCAEVLDSLARKAEFHHSLHQPLLCKPSGRRNEGHLTSMQLRCCCSKIQLFVVPPPVPDSSDLTGVLAQDPHRHTIWPEKDCRCRKSLKSGMCRFSIFWREDKPLSPVFNKDPRGI